jgi:hypothetical protein
MLLHFADLFREKVVARGLLTESELVELVEKLRAHLNDPGTIVLHWLFCRAWGRKPA